MVKLGVMFFYVNELTGASELSIDYNNPKVLYATMWKHQRLPWKVISGEKVTGYINLLMEEIAGLKLKMVYHLS